MPHTVHEHVRVLAPKRPVAPFVDLVVHLPELVGERLRGHPLAPQQLTDVVHAARADAGQIHVDQRLLDALLPPPVAFDHRRLEQGALELGHLESEPAGLDGEPARVVAGPVRLASIASLVSGGVAIRSASSSSIALTICSTLSRTMASSLVSNMAWSNCMISLDMARASFQSRFSCASD